MAKTFDDVVYSLCKNYTDQSQLGFKSVKQTATGFEIEYVNGTKATYTVQNMHKHDNMPILSKFSLSADGKLLYDGKPIEGAGGTGEAYDDTVLRGLIDTNKTNIATNASDIIDLNTKIGTTAMGTTATNVTGAVAEINGNQLDTVSFSADYKNIVLNRKNGTNPYTIPIASIINHAKLIELADIDTADIGNGKTLIYDATTQKHKYVSSSGTDELVKMGSSADAHYLEDLLDKQTVVNDNGILKVKKLDGQEVTIAEINYLKGLTMNVMDLVNAFANGGVKVHNIPVATYADLATMDRSAFIEGINYIVYVLADETHAGAKTTYLCDKTSSTYFGNADSQRNFTTNPIDLANEVTGKLGTSNIDVDSLWALLTIDDTYKTLTTTDNVFGTHGAKNMYDELTAAIGVKANATDLTTHTSDTDIHVTTTDKTKWDKVTDKVDKTDIVDNLTSTDTDKPLSANQGKVLKDEVDLKANDSDVVKKTDIVTTIDKTSTDDKTPSASAIYNKSKNKITDLPNGTNIIAYADSISNETVADTVRIMNAPNSPYKAVGIGSDFYYTIYNIADDGYKRIVAYDIRKNDMYMIMKHSGKWGKWQRVCTTSVVDVEKIDILSSNSNVTFGSHSCYSVVNGICYVSIWEFKGLTVSRDVAVATGMPKPKQITGTSIINANDSGDSVAFIYVDNSNALCANTFIPNVYGYGSFSYPVAE